MINKIKFLEIFKIAKISLYDNNSSSILTTSEISLFYNFLKEEITEEELLEELNKKRFEYSINEFKEEKGTALEFYIQHKKIINKDPIKKIVFLKLFQIKDLKQLNNKEEYPDIFYNEELRKEIIKEQNSKCFLCDKNISNMWPHLHHIDYNKKNCEKKNLIFLCSRCHGKTNYNRNFWTDFINEKKIAM